MRTSNIQYYCCLGHDLFRSACIREMERRITDIEGIKLLFSWPWVFVASPPELSRELRADKAIKTVDEEQRKDIALKFRFSNRRLYLLVRQQECTSSIMEEGGALMKLQIFVDTLQEQYLIYDQSPQGVPIQEATFKSEELFLQITNILVIKRPSKSLC